MRSTEKTTVNLAKNCFFCSSPTSVVQEPELEGWKKLSVDAIILANESSALEPPKYMEDFVGGFFPRDADR